MCTVLTVLTLLSSHTFCVIPLPRVYVCVIKEWLTWIFYFLEDLIHTASDFACHLSQYFKSLVAVPSAVTLITIVMFKYKISMLAFLSQHNMFKYSIRSSQLWLKKYNPKFTAFRSPKIKHVMNTSKRTGHCYATCYNGHFNTIQQHHVPIQYVSFLKPT